MSHTTNNRRRGTTFADDDPALLDLDAEDVLDSLSRCAQREYVATPRPVFYNKRKAAEAVS